MLSPASIEIAAKLERELVRSRPLAIPHPTCEAMGLSALFEFAFCPQPESPLHEPLWPSLPEIEGAGEDDSPLELTDEPIIDEPAVDPDGDATAEPVDGVTSEPDDATLPDEAMASLLASSEPPSSAGVPPSEPAHPGATYPPIDAASIAVCMRSEPQASKRV
jgi:hypothetical protein